VRIWFLLIGGPLIVALCRPVRLVPPNFHGCQFVLGRYPKDLPLLHRIVFSWWMAPIRIYDEQLRWMRAWRSLQ